MSISVSITEQTEPCAGCESEAEEKVVATESGDLSFELCFACACGFTNHVDRMMRELPQR